MPLLSKSLSTKARSRVSARNVFRPNGKTQRSFNARIVGRYRRLGANAWDDYELVTVDDGAVVNVFPTVKIQLEKTGVRFRMRKRGEVMLFEWVPDAGENIGDDEGHAAFLRDYVSSAGNKIGIGASAFIAKTLSRP